MSDDVGQLLADAPAASVIDRQPCGCVREATEEHDLLTAQCAAHETVNGQFERSIMQGLDLELDDAVRAHASGRRVHRIWGDERTVPA